MEGHCSTGQSPQWAVVPMEERKKKKYICIYMPDDGYSSTET